MSIIAKDITVDTVSRVLQEQINPFLHTHGGGVRLLKVEGKTITLKFEGACSSCPSLNTTLENFVKTNLQNELNDSSIIVLIDRSVSEELWDEAKKILRKHL